MKLNFKKISAIGASVLMTGMTMGVAAAASFPAPFVTDSGADVAIVYGASTTLDFTQTQAITSALSAAMPASGGTVMAGDVQVYDDEIVLGQLITSGSLSLITKDNKLSTLKDEKISWDDGTGSSDYDIHEEIVIGTMKILTTVDDERLDGIALSNEEAITYKLVIEDLLNLTRVGHSDGESDTLYLEILGTEYEIESMAAAGNAVTVTTSTKTSLGIGETVTVAGKTVTITDIFDGTIEVSVGGVSESIATSATEKINGIRVKVDSIGYHTNSPETSRATIKVGEDISKTYTSGDEYIGEDKDDPLWTWDIDGLEAANGYIGVKYNAKIDSANDEIAGDSIKYIGEGYILPNNYAAVTFDSTTAAISYSEVKISFEESVDLFAAADGSTASRENVPVIVVESEEDSSITVLGIETEKIYIFYNTTSDNIETYYEDGDGDYTPTNKMRAANITAGTVVDLTMQQTELATIEIGDTNLDIDMNVTAGVASLMITNDDDANNYVVDLTIGGTAINDTTPTGTLEYLGETDDDADALDITFNGTDRSKEDYDYMDHYGILLSDGTTVEAEADADEVTLMIPDDQLKAMVTLSMGATATGATQLGNIVVKDTEVSDVADKNLIVVGGSCINSVAANFLGGAACGPAFTALTGVAANQYIIKSVSNTYGAGDKIALVVAGYDAEDTVAGVSYLLNQDVDTMTANLLGTSSTSAETIAL